MIFSSMNSVKETALQFRTMYNVTMEMPYLKFTGIVNPSVLYSVCENLMIGDLLHYYFLQS